MICYEEALIREMSKVRPIGWLQHRTAHKLPTLLAHNWCYDEAVDANIDKQFPRGTVSNVAREEIRAGRISGCCDRADQY